MLVALAALLVGILLGLLGGGGGIVTVPTLMYVVGLSARQAVPNCLVILSIVTAFSSIKEWKEGRIQLKGTILFALMGTLGSFLGARVSLGYLGEKEVSILFLCTVLVAAFLMIQKALGKAPVRPLVSYSGWIRYTLLWLAGFGAGFLGAVVGVGGGFLMVPALNLIAGYPMMVAVGTNLLIIAFNSLVGASGYLGKVDFDVNLILLFGGLGILGSLLGTRLRTHASEKMLKLSFGIFLCVMSVIIAIERVLE